MIPVFVYGYMRELDLFFWPKVFEKGNNRITTVI